MRDRTRRYLLGHRMAEADWRLFPTLIRFDAVYHGHFKCYVRRIVDYTNRGITSAICINTTSWPNGELRPYQTPLRHDAAARQSNADRTDRTALELTAPHGREAPRVTGATVYAFTKTPINGRFEGLGERKSLTKPVFVRIST